MLRYKLILLLSAISLSGCDVVVDEFNKTYEASYKSAFKKSFMKSCTDKDKSEEAKLMCLCMVEDLISNYSSSELSDQDRMKKRIQEVLIGQCRESLSK